LPRPLAYDRSKRLVRRGDFQRAFAEGSRARGSILLVVARRNGLAGSRLGLSIGKSIWKSAVRRNRVRRIFRESFRLSYPELPQGYDLVLIAGAPALEPELEATRRELVSLARKAARRFEEKAALGPPVERAPSKPASTKPAAERIARAARRKPGAST
jgi:ribonuclease P protein component